MAKQGISMKYDRVHKTLGEGDFVLTVSEGHFAGQHVSFYDLFRVQGGKIAEHWDTIEAISDVLRCARAAEVVNTKKGRRGRALRL
jgi:predicted SnoaL-like aldol condensation-catalyzing enzyme